MELKIEISLGNEAFKEKEDRDNELYNIFLKIRRALREKLRRGMLHDTNGNLVGDWHIEGEE